MAFFGLITLPVCLTSRQKKFGVYKECCYDKTGRLLRAKPIPSRRNRCLNRQIVYRKDIATLTLGVHLQRNSMRYSIVDLDQTRHLYPIILVCIASGESLNARTVELQVERQRVARVDPVTHWLDICRHGNGSPSG
jgi:hypothetical protein